MHSRRDRPSLRHQVLARAIPQALGVAPLTDAETERTKVLEANAGWPYPLPMAMTPGLSRRFTVRKERLAGRVPFPSYVLTPRDGTPSRTLLYLHGGAFVAPIHPVQVLYAARLAQRLGARVVIPDYPLAPRHTWRDSFAALVEEAARWRALPGELLFAGDSAGGGLALAVALGLRERGLRLPDRMLLISPWVDLTTSTPDTAAFAERDTWLQISKLDVYAGWWAGPEADKARPEVSPALADLRGLPPTLMFGGTGDLLAPGFRLLADRAAAAGWPLNYIERPDLIHVFPIFPGLPESAKALRISTRFLAGT
ncbi:MAG: alpha/beta hydrolase [Nocardioides sp.]